jgi:cysteine synthase B
VGRRLKQTNPDIKIVLINFDVWPGVEGLKPLGQGHIVPAIFDESVVDTMIRIEIDDGYKMSKLLSSRGVFAGQSSGAYVQGAYQVAKEANAGRIVTILNDIGERYFSTGMWG